jgi:cell division protein DivIC
MKVFEILKSKKVFFFQIFLVLYISMNLVGGERGLVSYLEKDNYEKKISIKYLELKNKLEYIEHKNKLLSENIDLDYLDTLYRTKLKFGTKDEILIKLK